MPDSARAAATRGLSRSHSSMSSAFQAASAAAASSRYLAFFSSSIHRNPPFPAPQRWALPPACPRSGADVFATELFGELLDGVFLLERGGRAFVAVGQILRPFHQHDGR